MSLVRRKVIRRPKVDARNAVVTERLERQAQDRAKAEARKASAPRDAESAGRRFAPGWLRHLILERDGYRCRYCHRTITDANANMDHVVPWPYGLTVLDNLVAACRPCNQAKGSRRGRA